MLLPQHTCCPLHMQDSDKTGTHNTSRSVCTSISIHMCILHLNVLSSNIGLNTLMASAEWRCTSYFSTNTVQSCQGWVYKDWVDQDTDWILWNLICYLNGLPSMQTFWAASTFCAPILQSAAVLSDHSALQFSQSVCIFRETLDMHWLLLHEKYSKVMNKYSRFSNGNENSIWIPAHDLSSTGSPDVILYLDETWMERGWAPFSESNRVDIDNWHRRGMPRTLEATGATIAHQWFTLILLHCVRINASFTLAAVLCVYIL